MKMSKKILRSSINNTEKVIFHHSKYSINIDKVNIDRIVVSN